MMKARGICDRSLLLLLLVGCGETIEEPMAAGPSDARILLVAPDLAWTGAIEGHLEGSGDTFSLDTDEMPEDESCGSDAMVVEPGPLTIHASSTRGFHWRLKRELVAGDCLHLELTMGDLRSGFHAFLVENERFLPTEVFVDGQLLGAVDRRLTTADWESIGTAHDAPGPDGNKPDRSGRNFMKWFLEFESEGKAVVLVAPPGEYVVTTVQADGRRSTELLRLSWGERGYSYPFTLDPTP